jgi:hypothetical protein
MPISSLIVSYAQRQCLNPMQTPKNNQSPSGLRLAEVFQRLER